MFTLGDSILEFRFLHIRDWRLVPWYDSNTCWHGCCRHRRFSWLFLTIHWAGPVN